MNIVFPAALNGKKIFHGIVSRATNPLPANLTTTTFTLGATANPLSYYYQGALVNVTTDRTTILSGAAGFYFIYFDQATGNLLNSTVFPGVSFTSNVFLATVMWNGVNYGLVNDERHGYSRDTNWHVWAHTTIGVRYRSGLTLTHNGGTGTLATFATTAGEIADEDIQFTISALTAGRLFYQTGASAYNFLNATSTVPGYLGINARPNYVNGSTFALTEMASAPNRYINVFVYATTDNHTPIYFLTETVSATIAADNGYSSLANARAVPFPNTSSCGLSPEVKPIYRLIWRADGVLQALDTTQDDYRTVTSLPQGAGTASTTASAVSFNPSGNISSTTVQTAIEELDAEKVNLAGTAGGQTINGGTAAGETLTLTGTSSATKSATGIKLGSVVTVDEVNGNVGIGTTTPSAKLDVVGLIKTSGYTVATLPAGVTGARAYVTDATSPTYNGSLTGGGTVVVPVFYNGTAWVSA